MGFWYTEVWFTNQNSNLLEIERRKNEHRFSYKINCNIWKINCYLIEPEDWISLKGYGFLSFAKIMRKSVGKNMSINLGKNLSSNYNLKPFDHSKQSATEALKTDSKIAIKEVAAGTTGDLIGIKIGNKITKVSRRSPPNTSEIVEREKKVMNSIEKYLKKDKKKKSRKSLVI